MHAFTSTWRRSSFSGSSGGNCVELAPELHTSATLVRDSKNVTGPHLRLAPAALLGLTALARR